MAVVNVLSKEQKKEGSTVIVTKTVEEHLNRQDLMMAKQNLQNQKQSILNQMDQLKERMEMLATQEQETEELLAMLD